MTHRRPVSLCASKWSGYSLLRTGCELHCDSKALAGDLVKAWRALRFVHPLLACQIEEEEEDIRHAFLYRTPAAKDEIDKWCSDTFLSKACNSYEELVEIIRDEQDYFIERRGYCARLYFGSSIDTGSHFLCLVCNHAIMDARGAFQVSSWSCSTFV